jgi:rfaE bifunctional protein kinase chain/domain/rfaE bifunctional protein nucleotidyltransferase chain/domain
MISSKIVPFKALEDTSNKYKRIGKKVVLCHGMFDLVHLGHIRYFQQAKKQGDVLIVTITADEFCRKGPGKPAFSQELRAESLAALEVIDYVAICPYHSAIEAIELIKPNIYAKGKEYEIESDDITGMISKEREAVESSGGVILYTDDLVLSSSSLLNSNFNVFTPEVKDYLNDLRSNYTSKEIINALKSVKKSKVLIIGESIIDRYTFTTPLGQSGKGIHFVVRNRYSEEYAGGSIAVANHVASFVDDVTLFTGIGSNLSGETYETFIRKELMSNVTPNFFFFENAQTIVKERFVDDELRKFFEVYFSEEEPQVSEQEESGVCEWLEANIPKYDIVIVADYGNGLITDSMAKVISDKSKFLAINTQINSGNRGYHVVNRYKKANFISLNEPELRLASHNRHNSVEKLTKSLSDKLNANFVSITQGPKGLYTYNANNDSSFRVPALSSKVVDRVGAGDAFLSLSAICLGNKVRPEISVFVGATAAAIDVQIVGNKSTVDQISLEKYITSLLK